MIIEVGNVRRKKKQWTASSDRKHRQKTSLFPHSSLTLNWLLQLRAQICRSVLSIFLVFSLFGVVSPPAWAQKKGGQLEAQKVSPGEAAPPGTGFHAVKGDPGNSFKLYSATTEGLQISENGGLSWRPLEVAGRHEEVFALALHPSNPNTVFVGRRDGLWKSPDGGKSWNSLPSPPSVPLAVAVAKSQPNTLYLATARNGIHKSTDGGYQWLAINNGLPEARAGGRPEEIRTLAVNPLNSNVSYAAVSRQGIYRTTDGGKSWHQFNQGLPFPVASPIHPPKLSYDPDNPKRLYIAFNQPVNSHLTRVRLYVLSDNGEWLPVEAELPSDFSIQSLVIDSAKRTLQLWGIEAIWEIPLP